MSMPNVFYSKQIVVFIVKIYVHTLQSYCLLLHYHNYNSKSVLESFGRNFKEIARPFGLHKTCCDVTLIQKILSTLESGSQDERHWDKNVNDLDLYICVFHQVLSFGVLLHIFCHLVMAYHHYFVRKHILYNNTLRWWGAEITMWPEYSTFGPTTMTQ